MGCLAERVAPASVSRMDESTDTNAAIWKSEEVVQNWTANADEREWKRAALGAAGGDADPLGRYPRRPRQARQWNPTPT